MQTAEEQNNEILKEFEQTIETLVNGQLLIQEDNNKIVSELTSYFKGKYNIKGEIPEFLLRSLLREKVFSQRPNL